MEYTDRRRAQRTRIRRGGVERRPNSFAIIYADGMCGFFCMPFSARVIVHVLHSFVGFLANGLTVLVILIMLRYPLSKPGRIDGDLDGTLCAVANPGKVWEDRAWE
jgi:hypothetical protein